MSRAIAKDKRIAGDAYFTPRPLADALVKVILSRGPVGTAYEPHVGGAAFALALAEQSPSTKLTISDVDAHSVLKARQKLEQVGPEPAAFVRDFRQPVSGRSRWNLVFGNPPYSEAIDHVMAGLECADRLCFLLRLGFLESRKRFSFWQQHPARYITVLAERPSFTGGGTDSAAYALFEWDATWQGPTTLDVLSWKS